MKLIIPTILTYIFTLISLPSIAQNNKSDKLLSMSGIGTSVPIGKTADYFGPKISTTLGLNYSIGNSGLFLYPKLNLHAFSFNQQVLEPGNSHLLKNAKATTYFLNVSLGYRKTFDKVSIYTFAGLGGGFMLTPIANISNNLNQIEMKNNSHPMGITEIGLGFEYNLGGVKLFLESDYMYGFKKIEGRTFNSVPITFGIKPNLSGLLKKK